MALRSINQEHGAIGNEGLCTFHARYERLDLLKRTAHIAATSLRCWHTGEDVAVDAYLRIYRQVQKNPNYIVHDGQLTAIAFRTTNRLCCDVTRRKDYGSILSLDASIPTESGVPMMPADTVPDKRSTLNGSEAKMLLEQLIVLLPVDYQEPVILVGILGLVQQEAADLLGITLPAFKSRLYRGRQELLHQLKEHGLEKGMVVPSFDF